MRRLLLVAALVAWAVPASAQNCVTINGVTRCAMPWQIYDTTVRVLSLPTIDLSQTWNAPGVTFTGWKLNITDTNSATASLLMDLQVGGTSKFSITKAGVMTAASYLSPSELRIFNGTNLEYGGCVWVSNFFNCGATTNGGTARNVRVISTSTSVILAPGGTDAYDLRAAGATTFAGLTSVGRGVPVVVAQARTVAATNVGTASVATFTVGAADATFQVGCNVQVTTATTHSFSCDVVYTDETNTGRTFSLPMTQVAGTTAVLITNTTGTGPYHSAMQVIRAKTATSITIRTSSGGTFTTVVYNIDGMILQIS